nr:retrovirus-related Pol polyprotein from transposon TNT 1-94 [Tanacetum cinerariifolium]
MLVFGVHGERESKARGKVKHAWFKSGIKDILVHFRKHIYVIVHFEGLKLRAEGFDVDQTKRSGGRTLLAQKLLGILLLKDGKIKIEKFDGHDFGFWKMQIEDYLQALGVVRLSLAKNVAYNVFNKNTTYDLIKALSNIYEKPSASNKVFFIRQLVNTKMKEGASVADHVNKINSILSRLMSIDVKFDDEEDIRIVFELFVKCRRQRQRQKAKQRAEAGQSQKGHFQNQCLKPVILKDKEVHISVRDYDDILVCCVENTIEDRIMDSSASFHATFCKEELESSSYAPIRRRDVDA